MAASAGARGGAGAGSAGGGVKDVYFTAADYSGLHRYGGGCTVDNSLLYIHGVSPFCRHLVTLLPSWLAPNVLTMLGWACNLVMYLLVRRSLLTLEDDYDESFVNPIAGFLVFAYMILDASDGKQSVRTGSSSHLGELLDHSVDSAVMSLQTLVLVGVVRGGAPWALCMGVLQQVLFYSFHWREHYEENLELGMFNGPTEALISQILVNLWTLLNADGSEFWVYRPGPFLGLDMSYGSWLLFIAASASVATVIQNFYVGMRKGAAQGVSLDAMIGPALPVATTTLGAVCWLFADWSWFTECAGTPAHAQEGRGDQVPLSETGAVGEGCFWRTHVWLLMLNAFFSYLSVSCMVERMCGVAAPRRWYWLTTPVLVGAFNALFFGDGLVSRDVVNVTAFLVGCAVLLHFGVTIARAFCALLNIRFWTIPFPNKATAAH